MGLSPTFIIVNRFQFYTFLFVPICILHSTTICPVYKSWIHFINGNFFRGHIITIWNINRPWLIAFFRFEIEAFSWITIIITSSKVGHTITCWYHIGQMHFFTAIAIHYQKRIVRWIIKCT